MDKPAERLTREKQFLVRVPIGAMFTTTVREKKTINVFKIKELKH